MLPNGNTLSITNEPRVWVPAFAGTTTPLKTKRPARGDNRAGQAIWALGWMGARAVYSLVGEGLPLPQVLVAQGWPDVQELGEFFLNFRRAISAENGRRLLLGGAIGVAQSRFFRH